MAILIDLNQTILAGVMVQLGAERNKSPDEGLVRHMALNILRTQIKQFKSEYGQVIICSDNKTYWRKGYFPFYKAHRSKHREASVLDWNMIFQIMNTLKDELKTNFPYKFIDVDGAEADDVIGTLVPYLSNTEKVLIISTDSDFYQLQKYKNVKQYNSITKKMLVSSDPAKDLKTKLIKGDPKDGIPNMFSGHNSIALGIRQKPVSQKKLDELLLTEINQNTVKSEHYDYYIRNRTLIDFDYIPEDVRSRIIECYETAKPAIRMKMFNYFVEKQLKNLMDVIEDF